MAVVDLKQPTPTTCGQTCVAMLLGCPVEAVVASVGAKGTTWPQLRAYLRRVGWTGPPRLTVNRDGATLGFAGHTALCRVRWNPKPGDRRAHWVLYAESAWHDPLCPGMRPLFLRDNARDGRVLSYVLLTKMSDWWGNPNPPRIVHDY